jgi:hypothetical protein
MKDALIKLINELENEFTQLLVKLESDDYLSNSDLDKIKKHSEDMFNTLTFIRQIIQFK